MSAPTLLEAAQAALDLLSPDGECEVDEEAPANHLMLDGRISGPASECEACLLRAAVRGEMRLRQGRLDAAERMVERKGRRR